MSHPRPPLLLLAGLLFAAAGPLAADTSPTPPAAAPKVAVTEADAVDVDLAKQRTLAHGNARLIYEGLDLRADELSADRATGEVEATGHLTIIQQSRHMTGSSIRYNLNTGIGSLKDARVTEQGVVIVGEELTFAPDKIVAHNAQFTTCSEPEPHYAFAAGEITLTAQQPVAGEPPKSGRLALNHARIMFHGRRLFSLPKYSVSVGDLGKKDTTPMPTTGFSRSDGPFTTFNYSLGEQEGGWFGGLTYRYTTFRGIRGSLMANAPLGPAHLTFGYYRRQDPSDREIEPDDLEVSTRKVIVNREPEYGIILPERRLNRMLSLDVSWLAGRYSEREQPTAPERAAADRRSLNVLLKIAPYRVSPRLELSHAIGWRRSTYSNGDDFGVRLFRHTLAYRASPRLGINLSHVTRDDSGTTPFFFDGIQFRREIIGEVRYVVSPAWRLRFVDHYDPEAKSTRDMIVEATRTAHCLEYTLGWQKQRGMFYIGFGIAPPAP